MSELVMVALILTSLLVIATVFVAVVQIKNTHLENKVKLLESNYSQDTKGGEKNNDCARNL